MIKVSNGMTEFYTTKSSFDEIFSRQGYYKVEDEVIKPAEDISNVNEINVKDKFCEDLLEKPIAEWNKTEIKRFCEINEIDISGTKNANEAKELIKAFIEKE